MSNKGKNNIINQQLNLSLSETSYALGSRHQVLPLAQDSTVKRQNQIRESMKNNLNNKGRFWSWFYGNPAQKWYRSPGIIGSGFIFIIALLLDIINVINTLVHQNLFSSYFNYNQAALIIFTTLSVLLVIAIVIQRSNTKSTLKELPEANDRVQVPIEKDEPRNCPTCGLLNKVENFYCESCGSKLKKGHYNPQNQLSTSSDLYCPLCGSGLNSDSKYCPQCGNEIE